MPDKCHILVVDDEPDVLDYLRIRLERLGYTVTPAGSGSEALRVFQNSADSFDMLLTDVVMPKMSGFDVAKRLHEMNPTMKILFMSGYTGTEYFRQKGMLGGDLPFIGKPFHIGPRSEDRSDIENEGDTQRLCDDRRSFQPELDTQVASAKFRSPACSFIRAMPVHNGVMAPSMITSGTAASATVVKRIALECGFELAGIAQAKPSSDFARYQSWVAGNMAGEMGYLTDRRGELRSDPRNLLPSARSIICVAKLYNTDRPYSTTRTQDDRGWISRYAWGQDYHDIMRKALEDFRLRLGEVYGKFDSKICVDTAPLLERSYAKAAGLGWIGRNTCLINQDQGSWFFLGELLVSLELEPDAAVPDRCGTCTRCVDICPTTAIVADGDTFRLDATRCISYFTIELRGEIPQHSRSGIGTHIFGCDICQDVCPWNSKAAVTQEPAFASAEFARPLDKLAALSEEEFRNVFQSSPIRRAKYSGFLRNVAIAMGNTGRAEFRDPLERLAAGQDECVAEHAGWALQQLERTERLS